MDMELKIYSRFNLLPEFEKIRDSIPIFATQQYADYLKENKNSNTIWFAGFNSYGLEYILPFAIMQRGPFKKGTFLTATISLGQNDMIKYEKKFLNKIIEYIKLNSLCDWIQQGPNWAIFKTFPDNALYAPFGTYRIDLQDKTEEELFKNISRRTRQDINKAIRENVVINKDKTSFEDSIELISETLKKANISPFTRDNFDMIYKHFKKNLWNYTAYYDNVAQTSCIFFYNPYSTYAMYAGSKNRPIRGATSLLHWEAIKESKKKNIKYYDFVGALLNPVKDSKPYRIQMFKSHFRPELIEGFLWKMIIDKRKYLIFLLYTKIKNTLKGKKYKRDFIDQEMKKRAKN